jgi:hypothetical protein
MVERHGGRMELTAAVRTWCGLLLGHPDDQLSFSLTLLRHNNVTATLVVRSVPPRSARLAPMEVTIAPAMKFEQWLEFVA